MGLRATKAEIEEAREERGYWRAIGDHHGWRLIGWSGKDTATFSKDGVEFEVGQPVAAALMDSI